MKHTCQVAGFSVLGARHALNGAPCQDAIKILQESNLTIVAAADGHGDAKHARSDEGAKHAVDVTVELLKSAMQEVSKDINRHPEEISDALRTHLPRRISWEWNRRVKKAAGAGNDGTWHESLVLFGSTIMGAAFSKELALFVQLGDGDMLILTEDGEAEVVFDNDDDLYGSLTHSLCQPNSAAYASVTCRKINRPKLFILSTDGLRDSLQGDMSQFERVCRWVNQRLTNEGWEQVKADMPHWLTQLSERGNGDDATMGIVAWNMESEHEQIV